MFDVTSSRKIFHANNLELFNKGTEDTHPYVVRTTQNNGVRGYITQKEEYLNPKNTLSFAQDTFSVFFQEKPYFTGNKVKVLVPKLKKWNRNIALYLSGAFQKTLGSFTWGVGSTVETISNTKISLPTKNGEIDFDFMENFISQLEAFRLSQLEAYLLVTGLKDYTLTTAEKQALADFQNGKIQWGWFKFEDIFDTIKQGRRLKKDDQIAGGIPFVMAGVTNTGVVNYISNPVASFPKNSITIDIFGNAFYRSYDFGAGDDTGVYWNSQKELPKEVMLFLTKASEKALEGKFSYGKKLRSSQSLQFNMMLPTQNSQPDYNYMSLLISAIQKLVIKDAVLYADRKIEATKKVIAC